MRGDPDERMPHEVGIHITEQHPWFDWLTTALQEPPPEDAVIWTGADRTPHLHISMGGIHQRFRLDAVNAITTDPKYGASVNTVWRAVTSE